MADCQYGFKEIELKGSHRELVLALVCFVVFVIISILVVSGVSQSADLQAALTVNHYDLGSVGTNIMVLFTRYGREVVWGLVVVAMFLLGTKRTKILSMELAGLLVAGIVIGAAAKILFNRMRPSLADGIVYRVPVSPTDLLAYPSGHALIVAIGATFCLVRFRRHVPALLLTLEAALVCYSRVYVGVHYPLDVVGGVFLGATIALLGAVVVEKYFSRLLEKLVEPILLVLKQGPLDV